MRSIRNWNFDDYFWAMLFFVMFVLFIAGIVTAVHFIIKFW